MGLYDRSTNIASRRDDGLWSRCCGILLSLSLFLSRESKGKKKKEIFTTTRTYPNI